MLLLLHIAERQAWDEAIQQGFYRPESLEKEGFIHCSLAGQVVAVADALYRGRSDLALLVIDPTRVPADVRFEDCYECGQEFPHIYGPLPAAAVTRVLDFEPGPDGRFSLPAELEWDN